MAKKKLKIVRTPTRLEGGLTDDEKVRLAEHTQKWIANAYKTGRTDKPALIQAIKDLYRVSGLEEPIVVVAPSPFVMAVAGTLANLLWQSGRTQKTSTLIREATSRATLHKQDSVVDEDLSTDVYRETARVPMHSMAVIDGVAADIASSRTRWSTRQTVADDIIDAAENAVAGDVDSLTNKVARAATSEHSGVINRSVKESIVAITRQASQSPVIPVTSEAMNKAVTNEVRNEVVEHSYDVNGNREVVNPVADALHKDIEGIIRRTTRVPLNKAINSQDSVVQVQVAERTHNAHEMAEAPDYSEIQNELTTSIDNMIYSATHDVDGVIKDAVGMLERGEVFLETSFGRQESLNGVDNAVNVNINRAIGDATQLALDKATRDTGMLDTDIRDDIILNTASDVSMETRGNLLTTEDQVNDNVNKLIQRETQHRMNLLKTADIDTEDQIFEATSRTANRATFAATNHATNTQVDIDIAEHIIQATHLAMDNKVHDMNWNVAFNVKSKTYIEHHEDMSWSTYEVTGQLDRDVVDAAYAASTGNLLVDLCNHFDLPIDKVSDLLVKWEQYYQGGNMWSSYDCFLSSFRDVLGLELEVYEKYAPWEAAAKLGGFRYMASKFCIVSEFPDRFVLDENKRMHCEDGPSHLWMDGWSIWHLNGIRVDEQIVMRPETQTIAQIDAEDNSDVRAIRIERFGWARYLRESGSQCIDYRDNEIEGTKEALYVTSKNETRLVATCATGRIFALGIPHGITTCENAQSWLSGSKGFRVLGRT